MNKKTRPQPETKWVTVPIANNLHGQVRSLAVRQHKGWPAVCAEALQLWLAAHETT
ncbi:MAG: hypothetical protein U0235_17585 [Polyangiaceae bacterium]